jgi:hypothetical protein
MAASEQTANVLTMPVVDTTDQCDRPLVGTGFQNNVQFCVGSNRHICVVGGEGELPRFFLTSQRTDNWIGDRTVSKGSSGWSMTSGQYHCRRYFLAPSRQHEVGTGQALGDTAQMATFLRTNK